ncbi:MAG: hypothetical protein ABS46_13695 [Cytophagaceae bacterium SCN 52-12]|nr:MAG: hypothetical protein ABS46_13695 [Cytophagaceae bacterium SCN 52-12]
MREIFKHITDEVLWDAYRKADEKAFAELFQRHYRSLLHYGLKFTPDQQQAEDCIQELMIRLWTKRYVVNATESVRYYLLKSYRHILFRKLRQDRIYSEKTEENDYAEEDISVEDCMIRTESVELLQHKVRSLLSILTPRQREILYLRFYQNLTPPEIAVLLNINAQSVCNIIHRAFSKIREGAPKTSYNSFISTVFGILFFFF